MLSPPSPDIFYHGNPNSLNLDDLFESSDNHGSFNTRLVDPRSNYRITFNVGLVSSPWFRINFFNHSILWEYYGKRSVKRLRYSELKTKNVTIPDSDPDSDSGSVKTLRFHVKRLYKIIGFHDSIKDVILCVKHLLERFNASITHLVIDPQHLDHLETILSIEKFKKAKMLHIEHGTVSHEEMRRVLEDFEAKHLFVSCSPEPGVEFHNGTIPSRNEEEMSLPNAQVKPLIYLENDASWFKLPMLQSLRCCYFSAVTRTVLNEDVNQFLHVWCNGTDTNRRPISFSKVRYNKEQEDEEKSHCYQDHSLIDVENWDREKFEFQKIIRGLEHLIIPKDCDGAHIIQRQTDGMLMTVKTVSEGIDMENECHLRIYSQEELDEEIIALSEEEFLEGLSLLNVDDFE